MVKFLFAGNLTKSLFISIKTIELHGGICHHGFRWTYVEQTKELPMSSPEGNSEIKVIYFQELRARENGEIWYKD